MKTLVVFSLFVVILASFWAESVQAQTPVAVNMVALPKERVVPGGWINQFDITMSTSGARSVKVDVFWQDGLEFWGFSFYPWMFQDPLADWRPLPGPPYGVSLGIASGAGKKAEGTFKIGTLRLKIPKVPKGTKLSIGLVAAFDDTLNPAVQHCTVNVAESNILPGDPTGDAKISIADVLWVIDYVCGVFRTVQPWQYFAADVDGDGIITTYDAFLILRRHIGSLEYFPVEDYQGGGGVGSPPGLGSIREPAVLNLVPSGNDLVQARFSGQDVQNGELTLNLPSGVSVSASGNIGISRVFEKDGKTKVVFLSARPIVGTVFTLQGRNALETEIDGTVDDGVSVVTKVAGTVTEIESEGVPQVFQLEQNYPNPFNPSTTIGFALPERSFVKLSIYNTLGQEVAVLAEGEKEAGYHRVVWNAGVLPSGIYLCRLETNSGFHATRKMLLVK